MNQLNFYNLKYKNIIEHNQSGLIREILNILTLDYFN